jgi:hypothetical protein
MQCRMDILSMNIFSSIVTVVSLFFAAVSASAGLWAVYLSVQAGKADVYSRRPVVAIESSAVATVDKNHRKLGLSFKNTGLRVAENVRMHVKTLKFEGGKITEIGGMGTSELAELPVGVAQNYESDPVDIPNDRYLLITFTYMDSDMGEKPTMKKILRYWNGEKVSIPPIGIQESILSIDKILTGQ